MSNGGKTLTIKIKPSIKYSPPLQNQTVKAADIKYAMERCFLPQVGNGYAGAYYSDIEGVKDYTDGKAKEISGIQTPDDTTLVLKLTGRRACWRPAARWRCRARSRCPKDYAQKYDEGKQSTYGEHQVFTGPYMIPNDGNGQDDRLRAGQDAHARAQPELGQVDRLPAGVPRQDHLQRAATTSRSPRARSLNGQSMMSGDFAAPPTAVLKPALTTQKTRSRSLPSGGNRYIALNTKVKPLDNVNVRKAIGAAIDRERPAPDARRPDGRDASPPTSSRPACPGFEEAGGNAGPGLRLQLAPRRRPGSSRWST